MMMVCLCASTASHAVEYIRLESPQPPMAVDLAGPIDFAFTDVPLSDRFLLINQKKKLEDKPEFWRDARFSFDLRTYHFKRRNDFDNKPQAHSFGGQVRFESGWWKNFGIRAAYYNSRKVSASGPDTGLLDEGRDINVLGEAAVRYRITDTMLEGSFLDLGRQTMNLPYVNKHDIRQVPSAHEAYVISRKDSQFDYIFGHITKFKNFDSEEFIPMAEAAGAKDSNKGVSVIGARLPLEGKSSVGFGYLAGWDTFDTLYAEGTYFTGFAAESELRLSAQYSHQRSSGEQLVGDFSTDHFAAKGAYSRSGAILTLGGSITGSGAGIRDPWGGGPTYLSIQRFSFDRANEKALLFGLSWNSLYFSPLGISSFINVVRGWDARDPATGLDLPDRTEYDITIDYKPPEGFLEGLWVRARYNFVEVKGDNENLRDMRLILNYTLPFL
jgi:hypothetical protein